MEPIIKKAIEGGYQPFSNEDPKYTEPSEVLCIINDVILDPRFWEALGKACGWIDKDYPNGEMRCKSKICDQKYCGYAGYKNPIEIGKTFHEINLTEGWDKAVEYLQTLVTDENNGNRT